MKCSSDRLRTGRTSGRWVGTFPKSIEIPDPLEPAPHVGETGQHGSHAHWGSGRPPNPAACSGARGQDAPQLNEVPLPLRAPAASVATTGQDAPPAAYVATTGQDAPTLVGSSADRFRRTGRRKRMRAPAAGSNSVCEHRPRKTPTRRPSWKTRTRTRQTVLPLPHPE